MPLVIVVNGGLLWGAPAAQMSEGHAGAQRSPEAEPDVAAESLQARLWEVPSVALVDLNYAP